MVNAIDTIIAAMESGREVSVSFSDRPRTFYYVVSHNGDDADGRFHVMVRTKNGKLETRRAMDHDVVAIR